jgi:hypothetical protein
MTEETAVDPRLARLLGAHRTITAEKSAAKRTFTEQENQLKHKLELIEVALHKLLNESGSDNLKITGLAMAYLTTKVFVSAKDWDAVWKYIEESGNLDLLQRRLAKNAVLEYIEANDGDLPPGVTVTRERAVVVRTA